jgi:gamma-glutamylcyclotransferase
VSAAREPNATFYFAFGSNMSSARMCARIASARSIGRGELEGYCFSCNKIGIDGSAKANLVRAAGETVWGVIYQLQLAELAQLDAFEGGYERVTLQIRADSETLACETYLSDRVTDAQVAYDWYRQHMVDGAEEHGLPPAWLAMLGALPARQPPAR